MEQVKETLDAKMDKTSLKLLSTAQDLDNMVGRKNPGSISSDHFRTPGARRRNPRMNRRRSPTARRTSPRAMKAST